MEGAGLVKGARLPSREPITGASLLLEHHSPSSEAGKLTSVLGLLPEKGLRARVEFLQESQRFLGGRVLSSSQLGFRHDPSVACWQEEKDKSEGDRKLRKEGIGTWSHPTSPRREEW